MLEPRRGPPPAEEGHSPVQTPSGEGASGTTSWPVLRAPPSQAARASPQKPGPGNP